MSRQANPTLIGVFVLGAICLAVLTVLLLAGGEWFQKRRQVVMYFEGAAQGLQVGAPVVLLGVKVGAVKQIQLGLNETNGQFLVPVRVELDPQVIHGQGGEQVDLGDPKVTKELVDQGLRAQLRIKSLLTGQLYVDLNFHNDKPARLLGLDPDVSEIPTIQTTVEEFTSRLEAFPMEKFLADVVAISESVKTILASVAGRELPARIEATLLHLESLVATLDARGGPILEEMEANLAAAREAIQRVGAVTHKLGIAADRVGVAADRVGDLAMPDSAMVTRMNLAVQELAGAAKAVRGLAEDESPTVHNLNSVLQEVSRAARALRVLAETLEQQPEAILRGKRQQDNY